MSACGIGLVENEILEMAHPRITRPHVIQQPSWRGDDHVDAALERVFLRAHAHAAEDRRARDRGVDGQRVEIFENLRRELAGRRKDERASRTPRLVDQPVQDRQQERRRLATAGLRRGNHVLALQRRRNCFSLNRGGPDETEFLDALEKRGMKPEMVEWHGSLCHYPGLGLRLRAQSLEPPSARNVPPSPGDAERRYDAPFGSDDIRGGKWIETT